MPRRVAVYGTYEARVPIQQRYWVKTPDGTKQMVVKTTKLTKKVIVKGRYEFSGNGRSLYRAVVEAQHIMPKGYVNVSADEFLRNPDKYGIEGVWIDREIES